MPKNFFIPIKPFSSIGINLVLFRIVLQCDDVVLYFNLILDAGIFRFNPSTCFLAEFNANVIELSYLSISWAVIDELHSKLAASSSFV